MSDFGAPVLLVFQGLITLALLRMLLAYRGQSWRDLGLDQLRAWNIIEAFYAFLVCFCANLLFMGLILMLNPNLLEDHIQGLGEISERLSKDMPLPGLLGLLLFIGVYEELIARGFLLTRFQIIFGGRWGPVISSSVIFGLGHFYQGWIGIAQTTVIGAVLAYLTLHWRSLWPAIIAHSSLNLVSILTLEAIAAT